MRIMDAILYLIVILLYNKASEHHMSETEQSINVYIYNFAM